MCNKTIIIIINYYYYKKGNGRGNEVGNLGYTVYWKRRCSLHDTNYFVALLKCLEMEVINMITTGHISWKSLKLQAKLFTRISVCIYRAE